jgi:hypothetical protein
MKGFIGEHLVEAGTLLPLWFRQRFGIVRVVDRVDIIITVHPDGSMRLDRSRGAAEHR